MTVSRAFRVSNYNKDTSAPFHKRRKHSSVDKLSMVEAASDDEETQDLLFLFSDEENPTSKRKGEIDEKLVIL